MGRLGDRCELAYTSGLRGADPLRSLANTRHLGRLTRNALRQAYRDADLLVFPSRLEGFGYAAAEAMACGTPVVATNGSALPEVVSDGETGLLCPVDDLDAFEQAIRRLAGDPGLRRSMGIRGREIAVSRFSMQRMTDRYIALCERLLQGASHRARP
jgi:glycosyltransferase involved in cell wall biosynthesis